MFPAPGEDVTEAPSPSRCLGLSGPGGRRRADGKKAVSWMRGGEVERSRSSCYKMKEQMWCQEKKEAEVVRLRQMGHDVSLSRSGGERWRDYPAR